MSIHLSRAQLLLQQSRPVDAECEAGLAIAEAPDHPQAYALLAISRVEQKKHAEALEAAKTALGLAPDSAYCHYILTLVLHRAQRNKEALKQIQEAIRLSPEDEDNYSLLAAIHINLGDWSQALAAAEQSLSLDPENTEAANFRSMALVHLGRKNEAMQTVESALARDPESALSHANQGWNCLHKNNTRQAQEHFREALRLNPEMEYAREGMLEALKARNWIYRGMLAYFLWMSRMGNRFQWVIIVGIFFGSRFLIKIAATHPEYKWLWWIVLSVFYVFIYLTWTAQPLFNLLLRIDRFGRHILSPDQRVASNWFAPFFFLAFWSAIWFYMTNSDLAFFAMFILAVISICVAATFARTGRERVILGLGTAALLVIAALAVIPINSGLHGGRGFSAFVYGFFGFQILANVLTSKRT